MDDKCRKKQSAASVALGVVGLIFALLFPAVTYACSIPGLVVGVKHKLRTGAKAGMVMNIVALSFAVVNSIAAVIIGSKLSLFDGDKE